jgi:hypothetical protein
MLILWGEFNLDSRRRRGTLYARIIRYRSAVSYQSRQVDRINWGFAELCSQLAHLANNPNAPRLSAIGPKQPKPNFGPW